MDCRSAVSPCKKRRKVWFLPYHHRHWPGTTIYIIHSFTLRLVHTLPDEFSVHTEPPSPYKNSDAYPTRSKTLTTTSKSDFKPVRLKFDSRGGQMIKPLTTTTNTQAGWFVSSVWTMSPVKSFSRLKFVRCPVHESLKELPTVWHEIFAGVYFCGFIGDFLCLAGTNFCDLDRLVFLAGKNFCDFQKVPSTRHW